MSPVHLRPDLAEKVEFFRRRAWPDHPPDEVETHMSWVFLTTDRAYKLKKPVAYEFLDYRTLEARRRDCEAEVGLNQRLAPGVYLGVEPLTIDEHGGMAIGGSGTVVDWLVVMVRLPAAHLLDRRIANRDVRPADLDAVVGRLVDFYRSTAPEPMDAEDYRWDLRDHLELDLAELRHHGDRLDAALVEDLGTDLAREIEWSGPLGARGAHLVDGHGDLRPEHVVPGPPPLIIDRLSFAARFRRVDPFFDLALLALECEVLEAPDLAAHLLETFGRRGDVRIDPSVLELYQALRALTRARLSIAHLHERVEEPERWAQRSRRYLDVAARHRRRIDGRSR